MQATRLNAIGDIRTADVPVPEPRPRRDRDPHRGRRHCGTDRHLFKGEFPCTPPVTLGHEFSGIVTAAAPASRYPKGARVVCDPNDWCGALRRMPARPGQPCANNVATGIHRDGGFAEYAVFPARKAVPLPADLDPLHGAFCEPLACTLHGLDIGAPRPASASSSSAAA